MKKAIIAAAVVAVVSVFAFAGCQQGGASKPAGQSSSGTGTVKPPQGC
jgi:uncharacterized protein YdeI (BOF family)